MGELRPLVWPDKPTRFDSKGLALLLLALPKGTLRTHARHLARQALREALGSLLSLPMEEVTLLESERGPVPGGAACGIRISLSYAGDWALIGFAEGRSLGVDIVRIESLPEAEVLSRLYLPPAACFTVLDTPLEGREARFAHCWAEMEAGIKCLGLPLMEMSSEREQALKMCDFVACEQTEGYRVAVAVCSGVT